MIQSVLCYGLLLIALILPISGQNAGEAAARVPLENYLKVHATGDPEFFKKAFHPEARLFWFRDGKLNTRTSAEYIAGASGKPAPGEARRKRWIESVSITGNAGVAKFTCGAWQSRCWSADVTRPG
jgi:hypothetical protein